MNFNNSTSRNFSLGLRGVGGAATLGNSNTASSSGGGNHLHNSIKYVYELPYLERKEICRIFDENSLWETLGGGLMGYSSSELSEFGRVFLRGASPTDALLTAWASQNHTILELFTLFGRLTHFRAMKVIARFVDPKYHTYIRDPEVNATQELIQMDSPASPVSPIAPGLIPAGEHKLQNNIGYPPNSPKKLAEPIHKKNEVTPDVQGKGQSTTTAALVESFGHLPQIPYPELLSATNNWDRRNILGKGGFGVVFRGFWKNTSVAIKRMEQRANHAYVESQMKQSLGELKCLNSCRHDNILPLYGFSLEGEHPCLVYQFMVNGSLEDRLLCRQKSVPLQWLTRYHITRGVVCGIQFLHSIGTKPLIHGDIKSANILLDRNFEAKIGDFGLAREMEQTSEKSYVKVSRVHGTRPYLPDEYLRSKKLSTKVDTYSFGIMLFEIATGQRAYEESRNKKFLRDVIEDAEGNYEPLRDQKGGIENPDIFWHFIKVGRSCTEKLAKNRPEMVQVLKAFDLFISQQNTQASSIRTVSSHVTGIPLLFETPNSRPASLLLPGGNSTTHRLSPEMRATSPYWMPQSQAQAGYQTPPTVSTNQSIASNQIKANIPSSQAQQQQLALQADMHVRKSPLPSPSTNYALPPMTHNNALGTATPGLYNQQQQMINPFQQQQNEPPTPLYIGGTLLQAYNPAHPQQHSPSLPQRQNQDRSRNPSQQNGAADVTNASSRPENYSAVPTIPTSTFVPVAPRASVPQLQQFQPQNAQRNAGSFPAEATIPVKPINEEGDEFLPVFVLERKGDDCKPGKVDQSEVTDDEDHSEWTRDEHEDGPATVIPLITELGIKDSKDPQGS